MLCPLELPWLHLIHYYFLSCYSLCRVLSLLKRQELFLYLFKLMTNSIILNWNDAFLRGSMYIVVNHKWGRLKLTCLKPLAKALKVMCRSQDERTGDQKSSSINKTFVEFTINFDLPNTVIGEIYQIILLNLSPAIYLRLQQFLIANHASELTINLIMMS